MSDKEAQVDWDDDIYLDIDECYAEVKRLHVKLADACAVQGVLVQECGDLEKSRQFFIDIAEARDRKLAQARAELKDLQGANRAPEQHVAEVKKNRDYWYDKAVDAEAERDKMRKRAQASEADLKLNAKMLADQCDQARQAENERDFWLKEYDALALGCHSETTTDLSERLATLDAAEAALADCGSRGIYTNFDGPADAIMQMAARIERLEDETMIEVEITGKEIVEALQSERAQRQVAETGERAARKMLAHEHQLRQEAERRHKAALALADERAIQLEEAEASERAMMATRIKDNFTTARKLAAQIGEALDDSQA